MCNLIVQTLNDVYTAKKEDSEQKWWHITNKHLAAIEMDSCIDYNTGQVWILMPYFSLMGVLAAAGLFCAFGYRVTAHRALTRNSTGIQY
jgi:hypothetical protein